MNEKVLQTLEFNKIIQQLSSYATSPLGRQLCEHLTPMTVKDDILTAQEETSDALKRIWQRGSISFLGITDITPSVKRLEIGSTLSIPELLHISNLLEVTLRVKSYSQSAGEENSDSLDEYFHLLQPLSPLNNEIKRCILSEEEISDDASSGLKQIRRQMHRINEQIHSQLTSMISSSTMRTYLQENVITMRNGRYCIPVKLEYKNQVPGMVHDQSSTGSTFFIEPSAVVNLNNTLRELEIKEQQEIEKILADLSSQAGEYTDAFTSNLEILKKLDFIFAKGSYAKVLSASKPAFNDNHYIHIKQGRHPLLDSKKVVPIDIYLGKDFNQLIITGPNTGGKTVTLKTVGLFTLMGQAGLHIPAFDGSSLGIFNEVYGDIGDEQSIEQSLSTFSSHMTNIVRILQHADSNSLVLFDELCAGTDPTEGAALAMSILNFLHNLDVRTLATTHYSELKVFALTTEGICNACCEFNIDTLSPTYRLLIGIPGKSNAFAISGKLGLPSYIIEDAKARLDNEAKEFEDVISELENSKAQLEQEQAEIKAYKEETARLKEQLSKRETQLREQKEKILRQANEKAHKILQEAKDYADETIRSINKASKSGSAKELEASRQGLRGKLSQTEKHLTLKNTAKPKKKYKPSDFRLGERVKVLSLGLEGTVNSLPNAKGDVFVQMGILRSSVNINDLEIIEEPAVHSNELRKTGAGKIKMSKSASISTEINLLGMTVDEAIVKLDKYLDDACLAHLSQVRIVHGKGTGALRNGVHKHLKRCKHVKAFRLGEYGEGDAGVTIVDL